MAFSPLPLSYCTNVHPGRNLDEVAIGVSEYTAPVRRQLEMPVAAGLWLSRSVVSELTGDDAALERLAQTLWENDLCTYTLNAFPYGDFHTERVKEQVYLPDWTSADRVQYSHDCARLLARLLPEGAEGSISTVPLGGNMNPSGSDFHATCFRNLIRTARYLDELHKNTGRLIRLAVEPEPMCMMSSIPKEVIPQFRTLFEMADALGCRDIAQTYLGLCFDVCHQAVEFEDVAESIDLLVENDIRINKVHITNALELTAPADNQAGRDALCEYVEPRYLHQTFARLADGTVIKRLDLLKEDIGREPADEFLSAESWRIHFHVPVFAEELGPLRTTRTDLVAALRRVARLDYAPHLEVETYTWPVMPDGNDAPTELQDQIARELSSAATLLHELS